MKYILNHYYRLRNDVKRSYIVSPSDSSFPKPILVNAAWASRIHPAYAMMLSFFSEPVELNDAGVQIAEFFSCSKESVESFIQSLIEAKEPTHATLGGAESGFPINLIIEEGKEFVPRRLYRPEDFQFEELDLHTVRPLKAPLSLVFMANNTCYTDCAYCYADTKTRVECLDFEKVKAFVGEAKRLGVRDVLITGGDFFKYQHWPALLSLLIERGFIPDLISTKIPLSREKIDLFSGFKLRLQISLDTILPEIASTVLKEPRGYTEKMKKALMDIDASPIRYQIATVLTGLNDSDENLESLAAFVRTLKRIERWELRVAFRSLYSKASFDDIKSGRERIAKIGAWINEIKGEFPCEILWSPDEDEKYRTAKGGSQNFEGAICSANMTNMVILPDGRVTICEQLYWHPNFIIGDIRQNSISEIWNSPKALDIWRRKQSSLTPKSPCSRCADFSPCFEASNRCYANIMKAYGTSNYDFPDPRCHLAPKFTHTITHE